MKAPWEVLPHAGTAPRAHPVQLWAAALPSEAVLPAMTQGCPLQGPGEEPWYRSTLHMGTLGSGDHG